MKKSKRILAIVLSLLMVASTIDFSTFAADGEEDQIAVQVENDSSEQTEDDSAPAAKPVEEQRTEEVVTEEEPQKGAPQEPQQESEKSEKEQVSVAENTSEQPAETSFDATVTVAYDDVENIAGRRPKNEVFTKGTFLEIYADGQKMNTQPSIEYVPEADGKEHGTSHGMEADTYRIKNLSAYHEDGTTKIQYSVKIQPEQMIGYIGGDDQDVTWKKFDYAGPSDEVKLIQNKDGSTSGEKTFACYLPVYKAEGTITWNPSENAKDIPSIEEYFNQFFKVLRDGEAYTAVRVHYEQDEKNENIWHYSVAGLFSVREDGTKASYVFTFDEPEGWNSQNTQIIVDNNVENENVNFTVKEPAKKMFMQAAQPRIEEGPSVDGNGGSASFQAKWVTNTLPESFYEAKIPSELYFRVKSTDGTLGTYVKFAEVSVDGTLTLTEEAKTQLGITEEQVAGIKVNGAVTGTGIQTYTVNGLPNILNQTRLDEEGNEITEKAGTVEYGFWSAYGNGALIGQIDADGQEGTDYTIRRVDSGVELIETIDFTAMIDIHSGGVYKVSSSDVINAFKLESGEYTYTFEDGGKICYGKTPLYGVEWTISEDGTLTISNLPGYTLDKTLIDWKVSVDTEKFDNEKNLPEGDYFECEYNNSKVPNHGSDREICHNGGSLTLTIKGDTEYTGTKVWLDEYTDSSDDEKKAHRPEAEWELWRYSEKPGVDWSQSSPVRDDEGEQVQWTIDQIKNENDYTTERYLNLANLPKYDTDGYKYVYFIRESMSGGDGYEQVFGTVEENGTVNDTYPDNVKRPDKDKSLYNGGTLSNRHVGSVNVSQSKTWKAEAHQDELKDVFVRLVLQKSVDGGKTWEDTDTVQDLTNFTAEQLTKTASASMPKYDEFGNPYTYRWVEQGVYEGKPDESENVLKENGDFSLTHNTLTYADGKKYDPNVEEEHYESITEDGMIVNKLVGTTSYIIKKTWEGGAPEDASVEWILYQNDKEIQTGTMTATDNWDVFIDELPKYDENGVEYEYKATEKVPDGWRLKDIIYNQTLTESRNGYTRENNTCELVNTKDEIGDGLGDRILIRKDWIDDGDKACREEVQVRVVRNAYDRDGIQADEKEITKEPVKLNEVNLWEQYLDGEKYIIDNGDGQKILGTREDWQKSHENGAEPGEEDIASDVTYSIWEVGLKSASGNGVYYEPYSDMQSALLDVTAKNKSDNPDENRYIGNENHIYYIEYPENGTVGKEDPVTKDTYFSVTNRRVGVINIDVTKTWLDGRNLLPGGISDAERIAFEAMIQLKCEEYPNAVGESIVNLHGDSEIKGTVQEIQDNNGETANSKQSIGVNLDENGKEYIYFHNLPKYDKDGKVVHYNVEETSKDDELKNHDYQMNVAEEYTTGAQHTNDKEAFAIENKRSAVKEVTFYKEWKDQYRFDKKQRPDIYLTLYRKSASPDADAVVTEYDNIWWDQADISDKENDSNVIIEKKDYFWKCTFTGLPKYDENGQEIYYFATENMHVDHYSLEYIETQYKYNGEEYSSVSFDDTEKKYKVTHNAYDRNDPNNLNNPNILIKKGKEYLLREDGIFVNELRNNVHIQGRKLWKNIPGSFHIEDLPKLNIKVYRALENDIKGHRDEYYIGEDDNPNISNEKWEYQAEIEEFTSPRLDSSFELNYTGLNKVDGSPADGNENAKPLEQFDENGQRYIYAVKETVLGDEGIIDGNYQTNPNTNGYQLTNVYNPKEYRGTLTVKKEWEYPEGWVESKIIYPELKFTLYWRYKGSINGTGDGKWSEISKVDSEDVVSEKILQYSKDNTTVTFDNLPTKAPNGDIYEYYVVESIVNGYEQTLADGSPKAPQEIVKEMIDKGFISNDDRVQVSGPLSPVKEPSAVKNMFEGLKLPFSSKDSLLGEISMKNLFAAEDEVLAQTTFKNIYVNPQNPFAITGTKVWNDYGNKLGTRPEDLTMKVYRKNSGYAEEEILTAKNINQNGNATVTLNNIANKNTNKITVTWVKAPNGGNWTYTINGLDQYAPNGELWQYKIVEVAKENGSSLIGDYDAVKNDTGYITAPTTPDQDGKLETIVLSTDQRLDNQLYTKHTVKKVWEGINADIAKLPVTVKLQVKEGKDGTWQDAKDYFSEEENKIGYVVDGDSDGDPWSQTMLIGSDYTYTWEKLPKGKNSGESYTEYYYRAVETEVGNETVNFVKSSETYENTDIFEIAWTLQDGTTTVTNTLNDKVALDVTKTWDDFDNQYDLRPMNGTRTKWSVTFKIWRKPQGSTDESQAETVKAKNGTDVDYLVTVEGEKNEHNKTVTVEDLPKRTLADDGTWIYWTYYAKEVVPDGSVLDHGYEQTETSSSNTTGTPEFSTEVKNALITTDISGTKVWNDDSDATHSRPTEVQLELQISEDNGSTWTKASDYNAGYANVTPTWTNKDTDSWIWKYENLPITNAKGIYVKYRVIETRTDGYWNAVYADTNAGTPENPDYTVNDKITNEITKFTLNKVGDNNINGGSITDVSLTFTGIENVSGWTLIWTRKNGVESYTITKTGDPSHTHNGAGTVENPKVVISGLPVGTYNLTAETLPNGYETAANKENSFTLNADGTVEILGQNMKEAKGEKSSIAIVVNDVPQSLIVTKTDLGGSSLSGAVFEVTGKFRATDTTLTDENTVKEIGGTDPDKQLKPGDLVAGQEYTLKETKAPAGYILSNVEVKFKMDESGNVQIQSPTTDSPASATGDKITFKDAPIEIILRKTKDLNTTGDADNIDGAEFTLEKYNAADGKWTNTTNSTVIVEDGKITVDGPTYGLEVGGNYRLTETKAADGYILDDTPVYFKIDNNGKLLNTDVSDMSNPDSVQMTEGGIEIKIKNEPIHAELTKVDGDKRNDDDDIASGYAGVTFTLTDTTVGADSEPKTAPTDEEGKLTFGPDASEHAFKVIGGHTYTLSETAPTGYYGIPNTTITVGTDGKITFTEITGDDIPDITGGTGDNEITVTNRRIPGSLNIQKIDFDDSGANLEGAVFELRYKDVPEKEEGKVAATLTTGADGKATASDLEWGTYELVEVVPPTGYILDTTPREVIIDKDHLTISWISESASSAITNKKNSLTIYKTNEAGEKLQAEFKLYQRTSAGEWELKMLPNYASDCITLSGIAAGTYKLVEVIPPNGYKLPANEDDRYIIFEMGNDGKVTCESKPDYFTVENGTITAGVYPNTITMTDEMIQAKLQKVDKKGNPLSGAEFKVTGKFVSTPAGQAVSSIIVTDDNRETALLGELIGGKTYTIVEMKSPLGYQRPEGTGTHFTMSVALDGTLEVDGYPGAELNGTSINVSQRDSESILIKDKPIDITLIKKDGDAEENDRKNLAGVTFTLQEKGNDDPSEIQTATTDRRGRLHLGLSSDGHGFNVYAERTYILTETGVPAGYIIDEILANGIELRINADGTVTFDEQNGVITGTDSVKITVTNRRKTGSVILTKKDSQYTEDTSDDTSLNGITFSLYKMKDGSWLDHAVDFITGNSYELAEKFVWGDENTYPEGMGVTKAEDGKLIISGLTWGRYYIVESKADGYVLDRSKHYFSIGPKHGLEQYLAVDLGTIINEPNYVKVQKVDEENENHILEGAEFILTDSNNNKLDFTQWNWIVQGENGGTGTAYRLAPGIYTLTEVKAPDGYEKLSPVQFRMKKNGKIKLIGNPEQAELMSDGTIGIILKDKPIVVNIGKRFLHDNVPDYAAGAEFVLRGKLADGTNEYHFTSADGLEELKAVLIGGETYTLTEVTAPDGAAPAEGEAYTFTFTVDEDGVVTGLDGDETAENITATYDEESDRITVWNEPLTLSVTKKGSDTGEFLDGATYTISGVFAENRYVKGEVKASDKAGMQTLKVSADNKGSLDNALKGRLIIGETYVIREITSPRGYKLGAPVGFTVDAATMGTDGQIRLSISLSTDDKEFSVSEDKNEVPGLVQTDIPTDMKLRKVNAKGEPLAGVEFTLTGIFGNSTVQETRTIVSDKDGYIDLGKFINETNELADEEYIYCLQEKKVPNKYQKLTGKIYFRLVTQYAGENQISRVEVLYGKGLTNSAYSKYLKADQNILQITNMLKKAKTVKTGDSSQTGMLAILLAASAVVTEECLRRRKRRSK